MQTATDVHTKAPAPARRYAEAAQQMRAIGIEIEDDEYERIDSFTDVQDGMFLHLCGIAPFVAKAIAE